MGGQIGGSGNFNISSKNTVVPYEGIINENYFKIDQRETELAANLETFKCITKNPFNNQTEYFIGMIVKSKYDGIGRQLDDIDISIALDISGSMGSKISVKPTFKEMYENIEVEGSKDRLQIAKECLFKLVDSMTDKMNIAITTFNTESKMIIPLSPQQEIKSISNAINDITRSGGTNLKVALEGAANCLGESTAKFKRVIIITDGWDNRDDFMNLAREVNKKDILITILSIDESSNSSVYEKISELKGCNYFFILNESDMEKYLIKQLNYICFPALYDMKINFNSPDVDLIRTIGCGQQNEKSKTFPDENTNQEEITQKPKDELINTKTIFPSDLKELGGNYYQEGGLMLLKIKPKSLDKNCKIIIHLEYEEIEGKKFEKKYEIEFTVDELKNGVESTEIKKGIALYYYTKFIRKIKKFMNKNVAINSGGPMENKNLEKPEQKYFDFLHRNNENYDKISIYFSDNYSNELNEYQKEYYLKNLDNQNDEVDKKMKEYKEVLN